MVQVLYCSIYEILGSFPVKNISEKLKEINKDLTTKDKWVRSDIKEVSIIESDINKVQKHTHLQLGYNWIIKKTCIEKNEILNSEILFCRADEYIPNQIPIKFADAFLRILNENRKIIDGRWIACTADFMYRSISNIKLNERMIKLREGYCWVVQSCVYVVSVNMIKEKSIKSDIESLIKEKKYLNYE
jgi:hypothetical protein